MNNPIFENKSSKYIFVWPELSCEVSRMHVDHDKTSCQLIFTDHSENPHILRTRLNIETNSTRAKLAKDLTERHPIKGFSWEDAIEYISEKTMRELEHGEPVVTIQSTDETTELKYLVFPIIPEGKPTAMFGDPGSGKSQLAIILCIIMRLPWFDNPLRLIAPEKPTKVLYLDYEADQVDLQRQLAIFTNGMGLGWSSIEYRRCALPIADDIEGIRNHIEETGARCVIIDSVSLAAGGDLNRMDVATAYVRALRSLGEGITTISLAHTSKDRENKSKTILGSVLFEAGFRSVWEVRGQEDEDNNLLDICLFHRKSNLAKKSKPIGFRISYSPDGTTIAWHDPRNVAEFVERMGTNQRVLSLLKEGYATEQEIQDGLGISAVNCRVTMSRLKKKTLVLKVGDEWGLVT